MSRHHNISLTEGSSEHYTRSKKGASSDYANPVFTDKPPDDYQELNQPPNKFTNEENEYETPPDEDGVDYVNSGVKVL